MVRWAYGIEDKAERRRDILKAAADLFITGPGDLPTAAQVAAAAGLAKGTVYLYFRTKEAIFSALLSEAWDEALALVAQAFQPSAGPGAARVAVFLSSFTQHIKAHPQLLRLDALGYGVLKVKLEPAVLAAFKASSHARLAASGAVLERALDLPPGRGAQLLMRTYSMTRGLWQSFDESMPPDTAPSQLSEDDFVRDLEDALSEYWRGALAAPPPAGGDAITA